MPGNRQIIEEAISSAKLLRTHYFPTTDVQYLFSLIRYSTLVITPDTGIAHLASAENKPILGFYPQANEWLPFNIPSYIILPKTGELISSIPLELAKNELRQLILGLQANILSGTRIVHCENPSDVEIRK